MPLCQGRAMGPGQVQPCPNLRNDNTVRGRQGDLMLCDECTEFRFPSVNTATTDTEDVAACKPSFQAPMPSPSVRSIVVDEVLCYFISSYFKGTVDMLKAVAVSFYSADDLSTAKATLQKYAESIGIDGLPRLKKRTGPNKVKAEADDIVAILQMVDEQKLIDCLPVFVAANVDRLPTTPVDSMDVVILAKKFHQLERDINIRLEQLENRLQLNTDSSVDLVKRIEMLEANCQKIPSATVVSGDPGPMPSSSPSDTHVTAPPLSSPSGPLQWAEVARQSSEEWKVAGARRQKSKQRSNVQSKRDKKILGEGNHPQSGLCSGVQIRRKHVFHVDNVQNSSTTTTIENYLKQSDVEVVSCFPALSWLREANDREKVAAFRVCVYAEYRDVVMDRMFWPSGVIIREWKFKKKQKPSNQ